jgi:hypothetical protein
MKRSPLKRRSKKRSKQEAEYSKLRLLYLTKNYFCEARLPACSLTATDIHHKKGRVNEDLTDNTEWMAVCRSCHNWIETHPIEATELNFRKSKL